MFAMPKLNVDAICGEKLEVTLALEDTRTYPPIPTEPVDEKAEADAATAKDDPKLNEFEPLKNITALLQRLSLKRLLNMV